MPGADGDGEDPMRLCSVWEPERSAASLCVVRESGALHRVGERERLADVSQLIAHTAADSGGLLTAAVEMVGIGSEPIATWADAAADEPSAERLHLLAPVRPAEVWCAGVTYEKSRDARMHESTERDVYDRVYDADRPELFLKATAPRVLGPGAPLGIRADSSWHVPEAELGLVLGPNGGVVGYTLGNDLSSRDIEGENPLYLPQAKIFAGSLSIGPTVVGADHVADPYELEVALRITRDGTEVFGGAISVDSLHTRLDTLVEYLARDNWLAPGTVLLTGTGIVPPDEFTLEPGDVMEIGCEPLGTLVNRCTRAAELSPPAEWTVTPQGAS